MTENTTPARVTLTDDERAALDAALDAHHLDINSGGDGDIVGIHDAVARVFAAREAREAAVRAQIKAETPDVHAYAIEVLVNASSSHPYWRIWTDEDTYYDDFAAADSERAWLIDDGYLPEHVRVVEIVAARIAGGEQA